MKIRMSILLTILWLVVFSGKPLLYTSEINEIAENKEITENRVQRVSPDSTPLNSNGLHNTLPQTDPQSELLNIDPTLNLSELASSFPNWWNQFKAVVKDYLFYGKPEQLQNIESLLRIKPETDPGYYSDILSYYLGIAKDYVFYKKPNQRTVLIKLRQLAIPGLREFYPEWINAYKTHLNDYSNYKRVEQEFVCQEFLSLRPAGQQSDYDLWFDLYNHYLEQYNFYKKPEYLKCVRWLETAKPGSDDKDLKFLDHPGEIIPAISIQDLRMEKFNWMIKLYRDHLRALANQGDEVARRRLYQLESIFR